MAPKVKKSVGKKTTKKPTPSPEDKTAPAKEEQEEVVEEEEEEQEEEEQEKEEPAVAEKAEAKDAEVEAKAETKEEAKEEAKEEKPVKAEGDHEVEMDEEVDDDEEVIDDAAMDDEAAGEDDGDKKEEPEEPKELEEDAEPDERARVTEPVALNPYDATLDVFFAGESGFVSSLSQYGFQYLTSGIRSNTGVKAGRYLFEVKVLEKSQERDTDLRVGVSLAKSSLFLGDDTNSSAGFDQEGRFFAPTAEDPKGRKVCTRFTNGSKVIGVLLNLDAKSPNANTMSVFLDGVRAGEPQALPEHLVGQALFPTVTFRNLTFAMNFGAHGVTLKKLPFRCRMLGELAAADSEVSPLVRPAGQKFEVVVPVGLPEEGFFEHVDRFLERNPEYVELSERKLLDWHLKSGIKPSRKEHKGWSTIDRPMFNFGLKYVDSKGAKIMMKSLVQLTRRNYIVAEAKANLLAKDREEVVKRFAGPSYSLVASVAVGEPSADHKEWVHAKLTEQHKAEMEAKKKKEEHKAKKDKKDEDEEAKEKEAGDDGKEEEEDGAEPPAKKQKTDEVDGDDETGPEIGPDVWHLPLKEREVAEKYVGQTYKEFSLPTKEEGFDRVDFAWQGQSAAEELIKKWIHDKKWTMIVEDLKPGEWFKEKNAAWSETLRTMRRKARAADTADDKKTADEKKSKKEDEKESKEAKDSKDGEDGDAKSGDAEMQDTTEALHKLENGKLLYAEFQHEDWVLLASRYELHLLVHGFMQDIKDPEYPGIPEDHLHHYFKEYYRKGGWSPRTIGCQDMPAALNILKDTLKVVEKSNMRFLASVFEKDAELVNFVRLVEDDRNDRVRRIEAGDESARLKIPRHSEDGKGKSKGKGKGKFDRKGKGKGHKDKADSKTDDRREERSSRGDFQKRTLLQRTWGMKPRKGQGKSDGARPAATSRAAAPAASRPWERVGGARPMQRQQEADRGIKRPVRAMASRPVSNSRPWDSGGSRPVSSSRPSAPVERRPAPVGGGKGAGFRGGRDNDDRRPGGYSGGAPRAPSSSYSNNAPPSRNMPPPRSGFKGDSAKGNSAGKSTPRDNFASNRSDRGSSSFRDDRGSHGRDSGSGYKGGSKGGSGYSNKNGSGGHSARPSSHDGRPSSSRPSLPSKSNDSSSRFSSRGGPSDFGRDRGHGGGSSGKSGSRDSHGSKGGSRGYDRDSNRYR